MPAPNQLDIDLEKGVNVDHCEFINDEGSTSPIGRNNTNKTNFTSITEDGDTIYFGDMAFDRTDLEKVFRPQGAQQVIKIENTAFRPMGNPIPLGCCGYGVSTFTLGLILMGTRGVDNPNVMIGTSVALGGLLTFIAGIWCLVINNTFAATALAAFGGFYLSYAIILIDGFGVVSSYTTEKEFNDAMAFWLTAWAIYAFVVWLNTWKGIMEFFILIGFVVLYLITLSAHYYTGNVPLKRAAGAFAFLSALVAFYVVWAMNATEENGTSAPTLMMPGHKKKSKKLF